MKSFGTRTIILAANQNLNISGEGTSFYLVSATGSIEVQNFGGSPVALPAARTGIKCQPGDVFSQLNVKDTSGATNTLVFFFGFADYVDRRA